MIIASTLASAPLLFLATPASACLFSIGLSEKQAERIAATGYLVRARVIRGYDAEKRQPELLKIEKVFVGEKLPPTIELSHDDEFYRTRGITLGCDFTLAFPQTEPRTFLLALFPDPPAAPGEPVRFSAKGEFYGLTYEMDRFPKRVMRKMFALLVKAARRTGRLRAPPKF